MTGLNKITMSLLCNSNGYYYTLWTTATCKWIHNITTNQMRDISFNHDYYQWHQATFMVDILPLKTQVLARTVLKLLWELTLSRSEPNTDCPTFEVISKHTAAWPNLPFLVSTGHICLPCSGSNPSIALFTCWWTYSKHLNFLQQNKSALYCYICRS